MYKNHITKWKLDKRNKEHEIMAIVRKKRQREAVGKASEFHIRGRVINLGDVHRYLKRKGMSVEDAIAQGAVTPSGLRCCTPDAVPSSPADPEIFKAPQRIFVSINSYVLGSVESMTWLLRNDDDAHVSVKVTTDANALTNFIDNLVASYFLLEERSFEKAGQFLIRASASTRDLLLQEEPRMLEKLFEVILMLTFGWSECCNIILNHFSNMAAIILPDLHPLRHIFSSLSSLGPGLIEDVIAHAWKSFLDIFEQAQCASPATAILSRGNYISRIGRIRDPVVAEYQLRALVKECKEVYGGLDYRYAEVLLSFGKFLCFWKRYTEAEAAAKEVIYCAEMGNSPTAKGIWCHAMDLLARTQYGNFDNESAESTLRRAVDVIGNTWGWQDTSTLRFLTQLQKWLRDFGKHDEAADLSEQIAEGLKQSNDWVGEIRKSL
jgi:hypothetical protein